MKQKTINIYKFSELEEKSQEAAIGNYRDQGIVYFWCDEWIESLKEFCRMTDINLKDWSIGAYSYSYIKWSYDDYNFENENLSGLRLRTWLINNWVPYLRKGKYYSTKNKHRYSKIQLNDYEYSLTGLSSDYSLIRPILDFINKPEKDTDLNDIINDCMDSFISDFKKDMEYQDSDEYIKETFEANDYEFYMNGNMA